MFWNDLRQRQGVCFVFFCFNETRRIIMVQDTSKQPSWAFALVLRRKKNNLPGLLIFFPCIYLTSDQEGLLILGRWYCLC